MISSKLFAELQKLNKPSQHDFENENLNILKITSYLSFLESVGRKEISIFESQAICGLIRQASIEKYIEEVGDLEDTEGTAHFGLSKIRSFLDKLAQRNDKIISTQASISNMKNKPSSDRGPNDDKKFQKHKRSQDVKAMKANITKDQFKSDNRSDSKSEKG